MTRPIRVGIIGVNASRGWAREGHVPAVQQLEGLELVAVASNSQQSADAAAHAFGVAKGYGSGLDLIKSSGVDLVTVATQVADHRNLVLAAIGAGKHVYSEWPLGRDVAEAKEMTVAAQASGVRTSIGLQLRNSPVVRRARELIATGAVGRVLSASVYSTTAGFGPVVPAPYLYLEDPKNFANLVTIQGAHTIDLAIVLLGALDDVNALASTQYPYILAGENQDKRRRTTFDHLLVHGRTRSAATLSAEVAGGRPPGTAFHLEIIGETGTLHLNGGAARGVQSGRLNPTLNGAIQQVDEGELAGLPAAAANVAGVYAALRDDINNGTSEVAGFNHAVKLTQLITDILTSSHTGRRATTRSWPEQ